MIDAYSLLSQTQRLRISDGENIPIFTGCESANRFLILIWSQLGDFDSLEYASVLQRESGKLQDQGITLRAIGIGDRDEQAARKLWDSLPPIYRQCAVCLY